MDKEQSIKYSCESITWQKDISILDNPVIIKQFLFVSGGTGLFMAFLLSVVLAATGEFEAIPTILLIAAISVFLLFFLLCLIALIFFSNRFPVHFTVDQHGVTWESFSKKGKLQNRFTIIAGILGSSPGTTGSGVLAAAREKEFVSWKELATATFNDQKKMIVLNNSFRTRIILFCHPENYSTVSSYINNRISGKTPAEVKRNYSKVTKTLLLTAIVTIAVIPLFMLSNYPLSINLFLPLLLFLFALATVWLVPLLGWVVISSAVILFIQITWISIRNSHILTTDDLVLLVIAYVSLGFLSWLARSYLSGRIRSLMLEE